MKPDQPLTVSQFLELLNTALKTMQVTVVGEVFEAKVSAGGHVFFTLKDKDTGEVLPCVIWASDYRLNGVRLEVGQEVRASGYPNVWGKTGRLSFVTRSLQLVGEGALLQAYQELRGRLAKEGLFDVSRKRALPPFPRNIGVITSVHGAVVHDFGSNLRHSGFRVRILDCRVEGPESGRDLALSVRAMRGEDLDVLVLIRGGGSIQSLSGFDNEALVREIVGFPAPVITGIGHHQDVPLAALAADAAESTPSMVASLLGRSWDEAEVLLDRNIRRVFTAFLRDLTGTRGLLNMVFSRARDSLETILERYRRLQSMVRDHALRIDVVLSGYSRDLGRYSGDIVAGFIGHKDQIHRQLYDVGRLIRSGDPHRQLRLGFSLSYIGDNLVRSTKDALPGKIMHTRVSDGKIVSGIKGVK